MGSEPLPSLLANAEIPEEVSAVVAGLQDLGHRAYLVGGCVRDILRGVLPGDWDVATSAVPEQVQAAFHKVIPTGIEHGTVTVLSRGRPIEVTTFRTEGGYQDGRRPTRVSFQSDVAEDLARRDFTINAMAYDPPARTLVDHFGGVRDLQLGIVRCVGDPLERFAEDGLRALRAVRFAAVLAFKLDPDTREAIPARLEVFSKVARERICQELGKLLLGPEAAHGVALLEETGLLERFLPEACLEEERFTRTVRALQASPPSLELRLAALLSEAGPAAARAALRRLTFPNRVVEGAAHLLDHPLPEGLFGGSDAQLRRFASRATPAALPPILELATAFARADRDAERLEGLPRLATRFQGVLSTHPPLTARDLALDGKALMKALDVGPSPRVGEAARFLLDQVLEDPALNQADLLAALARSWHARGPR